MQSNSYWDEVTTHASTRIVFRLDLMRGEDCVEDSDFENEEENNNNMDNNNTPRGKVGPSTMDVERERCFLYRERPVHDDPAVRALVKAMETLNEDDDDGSYYESIDHDYDGYKKDASVAAKEIMNEMIKNQQRHIQQQQSMSSSRPVSISIDNFSCGSPQSCIYDGSGSSEESGASTSTATLGAISPTSSSTYLGIFSPSDPKDMPSKQQQHIIDQVVDNNKSKQHHVIADEVDEDMVDIAMSESDGDVDELEEDGKPTKTVKNVEGDDEDSNNKKKRHRHRRYSNKFGIRSKKDKVKDKKERPMPKEIALSESSSGLDDDDNKDTTKPSGGSKIRRRIRRKRSVAGVPRSAVDGGSFSDSEMVSDYATGFIDDEDHVKHDANNNRKYYSLRRIYKDDEGKHCIVS